MDEIRPPTHLPRRRAICTGAEACATLGLALLFLLPSGRVGAAAEVVQIGLDQAKIDAAPAGFSFQRTGTGAVGDWRVVADSSASGGRALAQLSTDRTDYRFPLAIWKSLTAADIEVTARFKAVGGSVDQAGGLAVRLTSPDDYYVVRANALENNVRFYRVIRGRREQIAGADVEVAPGIWHSLGLKAQGTRFTISYDGRVLYEASDQSLVAPGKIALWTKADSVTRFDLVTITTLP